MPPCGANESVPYACIVRRYVAVQGEDFRVVRRRDLMPHSSKTLPHQRPIAVCSLTHKHHLSQLYDSTNKLESWSAYQEEGEIIPQILCTCRRRREEMSRLVERGCGLSTHRPSPPAPGNSGHGHCSGYSKLTLKEDGVVVVVTEINNCVCT